MKVKCRLKELMAKEAGLTQQDLAVQTKISPTTIGKLYRNQFSRIDSQTILTLYKRFNCSSLADLLEVVDD